MPLSTASPASRAEPVVGDGADAHDHQVGGQLVAVGEAHGAVGGRLDARAEPQVDAVAAVELGELRPELGTEHPEQRLLGRVDDGDVRAGQPGGGGHLEADPAGTDDQDRSP